MSEAAGCPAAAVGCKRQRGQPYDWLWDADEPTVTAMLNFVDYDGPTLRSREHAVQALITQGNNFGGDGYGQWRHRLGKGRNRIKKSNFVNSVRAGMRWSGQRRGAINKYVEYITQQQAPVATPPQADFDAATASGGVLFACTAYKSANAFCALDADHDLVACPWQADGTKIGDFYGNRGKLKLLHARASSESFDLIFDGFGQKLQLPLTDIVLMQWAKHGHWSSVLRVVSKYQSRYMVFNLIFAQPNQLTGTATWSASSKWYSDNFVKWVARAGGVQRLASEQWVQLNQRPPPPPPAPPPPPPKPVVPPDPGPAPVKPRGERFAAQHPFTTAEVQLCENKFFGTSLKDLIESRALNFPEADDKSRAFMCMWQVATLCRPEDALGRMHMWILRLFRSLHWRGVRMGSSPRKGSMDDQVEVIAKALENGIRIFAPLDGTNEFKEVVDEEAAANYIKASAEWAEARTKYTVLKNELEEWLARYGNLVPEAPDPDDCVATGKVTTWEERDRALRQQVVCLDDCGVCASCMQAVFAGPSKAENSKTE
ncbi:MAG: hypothetical protein CMB11_08340 [Euryarchaeota archaeon]|nr:hypothetical protein [Euryarchaeota archaeon]